MVNKETQELIIKDMLYWTYPNRYNDGDKIRVFVKSYDSYAGNFLLTLNAKMIRNGVFEQIFQLPNGTLLYVTSNNVLKQGMKANYAIFDSRLDKEEIDDTLRWIELYLKEVDFF